jgi:hypothetical protein
MLGDFMTRNQSLKHLEYVFVPWVIGHMALLYFVEFVIAQLARILIIPILCAFAEWQQHKL